MTYLVLEPASLAVRFPKASESKSLSVRILAQVVSYDPQTATLELRRVPNVPDFYATVDVDRLDSDLNVEERESTTAGSLRVYAGHLANELSVDTTMAGGFVDITGYYNGSIVDIVSCMQVDGREFLDPKKLQVMVDMDRMKKL